MSNGAAQFIYPGSGSSNSSSAGTPDMPPGNPHMPQPLPPQFYPPHQFQAQETFYPHPVYISYNTFSPGDYENHEQQIQNEESIPSTVSTPRTEMSERSSNRSPSVVPVQYTVIKNKVDQPRCNSETPNGLQNKPPVAQPNTDSQVPVVSWQNLKNHAEDRQLHIRDGRRAFHPIVPPPPPASRMMLYQPTTYPNNYPNNSVVYPQSNQMSMDACRNQGQNLRSRPRYNMLANSVPYIPKFPDSFNNNNNNPLTVNNNFHDKKSAEANRSRQQQRIYVNKPRKGGGFRSPSSKPKLTNPIPYLSSCPSQVMPQPQPYDRPMMAAIAGQRWANNPPQVKRVIYSKRQNGSNSNVGSTNNMGASRFKKSNASPERDGSDIGGGGDTQSQPISQLALTPPSTPSNTGSNRDVTSKMQTLTLGSTS